MNLSGSSFFGTTQAGGGSNEGIAFSLAGSTEKVLQSFNLSSEPNTVMYNKGWLYGTDGGNGDGEVFRLGKSGG
jgi:uncharacterized repeat protein (TIGR03803 family)